MILAIPRFAAQRWDPRFAQENPRMVRIRTLRITIHSVCLASLEMVDDDTDLSSNLSSFTQSSLENPSSVEGPHFWFICDNFCELTYV